MQTQVLSERQSMLIPGVSPTDADRRALPRLEMGGRLTIEEAHQGIRVETHGWVGVVSLQCCRLQIEPRLVEGHTNLIRLLDFVSGFQLLKRLQRSATFSAEGLQLFDLIAWLLASACDEVLRRGVLSDYIEHQEDLKTLRGRLDVRRQLLNRWGRVDRLECTFEDRVRVIPENRWLLRALRHARRGATDPTVAVALRRTTAVWDELSEDNPSEILAKPVITRVNHHYREALEIAYLVLGMTSISDVLSGSDATGFSFLLNMPRLFELFVSRVIEHIGRPHVKVEPQPINRSILWDVEGQQSYGSVRPDVVLRFPSGDVLPVDAKYKDYDVDKIDQGDVYQTAIYALTIGRSPQRLRSVILYPARPARRRQVVQVRVSSLPLCDIEAVGVSVPGLLDELAEARMGPELQSIASVLSCERSSSVA